MEFCTLLPSKCMFCSRDVVSENLPICRECISYVQEAIVAPCRNCGFGADLCKCYRGSHFAMFYGRSFGSLAFINFMKEYGDGAGMDFIAELMFSVIRMKPSEFDAVSFVPRTRANYRRTGFDQSAELAKAISRRYGIKFISVLKSRRRREQKHLDRSERRENMRSKISVNQRALPEQKYRKLLLVDDILTTGATSEACATALRKSVANQVVVATFTHGNTQRKQL